MDNKNLGNERKVALGVKIGFSIFSSDTDGKSVHDTCHKFHIVLSKFTPVLVFLIVRNVSIVSIGLRFNTLPLFI